MADDLSDNRLTLSGNSATRDRRWLRTRKALIEAFNRLVLDRKRGGRAVSVAEVVAGAEVGRSTFYDHFHNAEALHMEALALPFRPVADAAAGRGDQASLTSLLEHFWENRSQARGTLQGRTGERAERLLATMVEQRLDGVQLTVPTRLAATMLARAALAPIRSWLFGEAWCAAEILSEAICNAGAAATAALRATP
jgi:AcrR family transcriptional regulator